MKYKVKSCCTRQGAPVVQPRTAATSCCVKPMPLPTSGAAPVQLLPNASECRLRQCAGLHDGRKAFVLCTELVLRIDKALPHSPGVTAANSLSGGLNLKGLCLSQFFHLSRSSKARTFTFHLLLSRFSRRGSDFTASCSCCMCWKWQGYTIALGFLGFAQVPDGHLQPCSQPYVQ